MVRRRFQNQFFQIYDFPMRARALFEPRLPLSKQTLESLTTIKHAQIESSLLDASVLRQLCFHTHACLLLSS
jgi:hypothetical protein